MRKILLLSLIAVLLWAFYASGLLGHLSLENLQHERLHWQNQALAAPWTSGFTYFALYVGVAGLAVPGAAVVTLAGGAIFGFWKGVLLVSFASTLGAAVSFLLSRYLLRDFLKKRFAKRFSRIEAGFAKDATFYLFFLRLSPAFPFFLVNVFASLTTLSLFRFCWVSQLAMLPATLVYVNAGTEIGRLQSLRDALSPRMLLAFTLMAIFPLVAKFSMNRWIGVRDEIK